MNKPTPAPATARHVTMNMKKQEVGGWKPVLTDAPCDASDDFQHEEDCPCWGDSVAHSEDCANCTCEPQLPKEGEAAPKAAESSAPRWTDVCDGKHDPPECSDCYIPYLSENINPIESPKAEALQPTDLIVQIKRIQGLVNDERPQQEILVALESLLHDAYGSGSAIIEAPRVEEASKLPPLDTEYRNRQRAAIKHYGGTSEIPSHIMLNNEIQCRERQLLASQSEVEKLRGELASLGHCVNHWQRQAERLRAEVASLTAELSQHAFIADAATSDVVHDRLHVIPQLRERAEKAEAALGELCTQHGFTVEEWSQRR